MVHAQAHSAGQVGGHRVRWVGVPTLGPSAAPAKVLPAHLQHGKLGELGDPAGLPVELEGLLRCTADSFMPKML